MSTDNLPDPPTTPPAKSPVEQREGFGGFSDKETPDPNLPDPKNG